MKLIIPQGTTSKLIRVFIPTTASSNGAGLTGLAHNSSGLKLYYIREGASSATQITLVTMTVGTWTSSGFKEIDATNMPGWYEIGLPDAVLAAGANSVALCLCGAANMPVVPIEIQLYDLPKAILTEAIDGVESSATAKCLAWALAMMLNKSSLSGGTITVNKTDNTTTYFTQGVTQTGGTNPITAKNESS